VWNEVAIALGAELSRLSMAESTAAMSCLKAVTLGVAPGLTLEKPRPTAASCAAKLTACVQNEPPGTVMGGAVVWTAAAPEGEGDDEEPPQLLIATPATAARTAAAANPELFISRTPPDVQQALSPAHAHG
jgi:hypothetical protein